MTRTTHVGAGRREDEFQAMLEDAGFAVEVLPLELLHEEHQSGHYRVIRAAKRD